MDALALGPTFEPALTAAPGVMATDATVPAMGLRRLASDRSCWAEATWALATSSAAWSLANCWGVATDDAPDEPPCWVEPVLPEALAPDPTDAVAPEPLALPVGLFAPGAVLPSVVARVASSVATVAWSCETVF